MPDLVRPAPPRPLRDRVAQAAATVGLARVATLTGAVLVVVAASWWLLRSPPAPVEESLPRAAAAPPTAGDASMPTSAPAGSVAAGPAEVLVVQAAGAVAHPGVYRVPAGSRVTDLVAAAGGATPEADLDALALAARLVDGQRVYVPRPGEAVPAATDPSDTGPSPPVDLNTATADQLDELPGVGPATAAAIVAHRERRGPFRSVDGLLEVRGIGPAKLDQLRGLVRV